MLDHIGEQTKHIDALDKVDSQALGIKWRDAKIESITFQLARSKAWRFGAETERMNASSARSSKRRLLPTTRAWKPSSLPCMATLQTPPRLPPKREALPEHLPRVEQRIEPEDTHCPTPECAKPVVRVGEDISERLDIIPAQFFVQRQIRGKWACKCCQLLVQEPAAPQVFDNCVFRPS